MHPDLALPQDAFGRRALPFRPLIDANRSRSIMIVGSFPDDSAKSAYWLYPRGIVSEVRPLTETASLDELSRDAEAALNGTHPPSAVDLPFRPWERLVRNDYTSAYYRVGSEYENAANIIRASAPSEAQKGFAAARMWYERALAVDPGYAPALAALRRLP
jgi:hypothetical protein